MRNIHLEILRQGPPHNQLLSPLTEYLALCENHPAVPVRLPFEHADFSVRLDALQYRREADYRHFEVEEVTRWMTSILAQVPGLIRELADQSGGGNEVVNLRLTLSANELALLPFELASASYVFGSAGAPMLLQSQSPVCVTREGRRLPAERLDWPPPPNPRILFAAAGPLAPIPLQQHLLVLRQAIDPWVSYYQDDNERRERVAEHLTVLPQATLEDIQRECASANYTNVHILSHGVPFTKGTDVRYGLALHDRFDPSKADVVDAQRLAKAIRPPRRDGKPGFARPAIVTLAACDAGAQGGITWSGASIAHALHEEGIPLVVASQFPMSFGASIIMTQVLYRGLLGGEDPRTLLVHLRRELVTQSPATHDWASIVAYASFPQSFDQQMSRMRTEQSFRRFEAAINHVDKKLRHSPDAPWKDEKARVEQARAGLNQLLEDTDKQDPKIYGILASAEKRMAEIYWKTSGAQTPPADAANSPGSPAPGQTSDLEVRDMLMSAVKHYNQAFERDRSQVWALVQVLALQAVLRRWNGNEALSFRRWELAKTFSEEEVELGNQDRWSWAYANLAELYVLAPLIPETNLDKENAATIAEGYAMKFRSVTEFDSINLHSTRRQFERYAAFFSKVNPGMASVETIANKVLEILPRSRKYS